MASSVLNFADRPARGAKSSAEIVPSAPRMSPTCASSRTAVRVMVAMVNTPFTSCDLTGRGAHARGPYASQTGPARTRAGAVVGRISSVQRENLQGLACAGTEWDSSEEGQLRPGLSESIACLPSVATHGGARQHVPLRHVSVTLEETTGQSGIVQPHLSRKSFGTPRRIAMGLTASHLASPLGPGRGVLIRSVSRRLGSVAYVREDASPNEVSCLTSLRMPPATRG